MGVQKEKALEIILWILLLAHDRYSGHTFLLLPKSSRDKEPRESERSGVSKRRKIAEEGKRTRLAHGEI